MDEARAPQVGEAPLGRPDAGLRARATRLVGALLGHAPASPLLRRAAPGSAAPREAGHGRLSAADIVTAVSEPLAVVDGRGLVLLANEAAHRLMPLLREGRPFSFALRSPDVLEGLETARRTRLPIEVEHEDRVPPGRHFRVRISAVARGGEGAPDCAPPGALVILFRDITPERRVERMRVDFIANASHELRTPLASLLGFVETLQGPARDDERARERFLGIMREQGRRMARLIDDLLSLSRIELSVHVQPDTPVEVEPLVRHVVEALGPLARERGVELHLEAGPGPRLVPGARDELLRVFENLVENAVKYGRSGGRVEVAIEDALEPGRGGDQVAVSVRDFGPGIAPEHLPRLTERFYRVDVADSRAQGGTGLGLAIVKHILTRHRGRLVVESRPGEGALFRVLLPRAG